MTENSIELTEQHVTCCDECPLWYDTIRCDHPEADGEATDFDDASVKAPDWCPLRVRPLLIKLVTP